MRNNSFLSIRSRISSNKIKAPLRFVYDLYGLLDHLTAQKTQLIYDVAPEDSHFFAKVEESDVTVLYISHCLNKLTPDEKNFLRQLNSYYLRTFVISNCDEHKNHSWPGIGNVWTRHNRGRDLGAIRDFMRFNSNQVAMTNLCILNSSCHWSLKRLRNLLDEILWEDLGGVLFGTESKQGISHFQTFFILVPRNYLIAFANVTEFFKNWRTKRGAVVFGEYEVGKNLNKAGLCTKSIYSGDFGQVNPSIVFAGKLLLQGAPFLKKSAGSKRLLNEYSEQLVDFSLN